MKEGDTKIVVATWHTCANCGARATRLMYFLLPHARSNPASAGYGGDDISHCYDYKMYVCTECSKDRSCYPDGYEWSAEHRLDEINGKNAHIFMYWKDSKREDFVAKNVREIIAGYLRERKADGLCMEDCGIYNLEPCEHLDADLCVPARRRLCPNPGACGDSTCDDERSCFVPVGTPLAEWERGEEFNE